MLWKKNGENPSTFGFSLSWFQVTSDSLMSMREFHYCLSTGWISMVLFVPPMFSDMGKPLEPFKIGRQWPQVVKITDSDPNWSKYW